MKKAVMISGISLVALALLVGGLWLLNFTQGHALLDATEQKIETYSITVAEADELREIDTAQFRHFFDENAAAFTDEYKEKYGKVLGTEEDTIKLTNAEIVEFQLADTLNPEHNKQHWSGFAGKTVTVAPDFTIMG